MQIRIIFLMTKHAYRLKEIAAEGPFGLTWVKQHISQGRLPAHKQGGVVFVLADDWDLFLRQAPSVLDARKLKQNQPVEAHLTEVVEMTT
jgi:hypothetical protein